MIHCRSLRRSACRRFRCPHRLVEKCDYPLGDSLGLLSQLWNGNALLRLADTQLAEGEEAIVGASRVITGAPIAGGIQARVMGEWSNRSLGQEVPDERARNPFDVLLQAGTVEHLVYRN